MKEKENHINLYTIKLIYDNPLEILQLYDDANNNITEDDVDLFLRLFKKFNQDALNFESYLIKKMEQNLFKKQGKSGDIYIKQNSIEQIYDVKCAREFIYLAIDNMLKCTIKYQNLYIFVSPKIYIGNDKNKLKKDEPYIKIHIDIDPYTESILFKENKK
jgi:hypothetical protein|tara:strand:- start:236 stop:715 length:480 start_codon:yes stop_codon:yes gene_type:complete